MHVTLSTPDLATLGPRWRALEPRAAPSLFQSWTWVGCQVEARFDRPVLLAAELGGVDVALGLFNRRRRRLWLHETGDPALDAPFIERNGFLLDQAHIGALPALLGALPGRVVLSGVEAGLAQAARSTHAVIDEQIRPAPVLDLAQPSLSNASASTRSQVRRSLRRYAERGTLSVARADEPAQARAWLDELIGLHEATWRARGKPGAFADPRTLAFHHALIERGVLRDEVDLLRIAAGQEVIGVLYNLRRAGRVHAYQSGFVYPQGAPQLKPGLTCHTLAAGHYRALGADSYDFLGGGDRYKRSLATREDRLHWVRLAPRGSAAALAGRLRDALTRRCAMARGTSDDVESRA